ncbi:MAG: PAS domain S-box protein [Lacrimispora sp.]|uniref:sensor domain-containing diguanylate cyclase/phosphohydrolase n=1 Tax=Lacrimispora sp. TaxID=2719234 RepID=UPI0039E5196F
MKNEGMESIFMQMPIGYARLASSVEKTAPRRQYILMDANDTFFHCWGLNRETSLNQEISQLLNDVSDTSAWENFYENLNHAKKEKPFIINIGECSFQVTLRRSGRSKEITAFFTDITGIYQQLQTEQCKNEKLAEDIDIFFNSTQDGLFIVNYVNGEFRYLRNNMAHQNLTGLTAQQLRGKTPVQALGETGALLQNGYQKCVDSGESLIYEETATFNGKSRRWLVRLTPVKENGQVSYIVGSRTDITDLRRLEIEKEQLLENLNSMFTSHSAVMLIVDRENGRILDANPKACSFYGYTKEELLAMNMENINGTIHHSQIHSLTETDRYFLYPHRLKSGEIRMVDIYTSLITYEGKKQLFSIIFDVSDREKFKDDLSKEKELLSVTFNSIGDGVVTTDNEGLVTSLNKAASDITGWKNEEAFKKPFDEIFDLRNEATGESASSPISEVLRTGKTVGLANHTVLFDKQGYIVPIADSAAPIRDEKGQMYGVVMVFRDVSQEKTQQERILYLSYHDSLTGMFNRRYMEEELLRIDRPDNLPIAVIMGDVNGLKVSNDVFGHKTGDLLLKSVAEAFQQTIGEMGVSARWGGDEFLVLLPKTDAGKAQKLVRKLEETLKKNDSLPFKISVALGIDVKFDENIPFHQVLQKAEERMYHKKLMEGKTYRNSIMNSLLSTLYERSTETIEHSLRMEAICLSIAEKLNLTLEERDELSLFAMLHDIGNVGVRTELLTKPGPLDEEEWKELRRHPELGYRIAQNTPELSMVSEYILSHHERWDGNGYPRGLKGTDIPLLCRIMSIADSYDAMTNDRPYRKAMEPQAAKEEIKKLAGKQFDPYIAEVFLELDDPDL